LRPHLLFTQPVNEPFATYRNRRVIICPLAATGHMSELVLFKQNAQTLFI
jgi:hypothetical protein